MQYVCPYDGCRQAFVSEGNRTQHLKRKHRFATKAGRTLKSLSAAPVSQSEHDSGHDEGWLVDPSQNDGLSESNDRVLTIFA